VQLCPLYVRDQCARGSAYFCKAKPRQSDKAEYGVGIAFYSRYQPDGIKTAVKPQQSLFYNRATVVFDGQDRRRCDEDGESKRSQVC
jgi:hypothetical protein